MSKKTAQKQTEYQVSDACVSMFAQCRQMLANADMYLARETNLRKAAWKAFYDEHPEVKKNLDFVFDHDRNVVRLAKKSEPRL